jgi:hypothetical protein
MPPRTPYAAARSLDVEASIDSANPASKGTEARWIGHTVSDRVITLPRLGHL